MSSLTLERDGVKESISLNPITLTVNRPAIAVNDRGVNYVNYSSLTPTLLTNEIRIALTNKRGSEQVEIAGRYNNTKAFFIISDYQTEIKKHDRFTWNSKDWEIMDVEKITFEGSLKNYQAELKELTQGNV